MSWRTVVIENRCKLDYKLGYMVVRGEETKKVFLEEVAVIIIENPAVSLTSCLLASVVEKKIKLIFCDKKRNPNAELVPLYGCYDTAEKIKKQIKWSSQIKGEVWTTIVSEKIKNQSLLLKASGKVRESEILLKYLSEIQFNDTSNREGHSAKVYFNALFGKNFLRDAPCEINSALDYGYSLILSAVNREVVSCGYLTQLGLFHDNRFNYFNLSCDFMEPFRPYVDRYVFNADFIVFDPVIKRELIKLIHSEVFIEDTKQTMMNAIKIYVNSIFAVLNGEEKNIIFPDYEL